MFREQLRSDRDTLEESVALVSLVIAIPTVAKKGPEKKPNRLMVTASTYIFGTLHRVSVMVRRYEKRCEL